MKIKLLLQFSSQAVWRGKCYTCCLCWRNDSRAALWAVMCNSVGERIDLISKDSTSTMQTIALNLKLIRKHFLMIILIAINRQHLSCCSFRPAKFYCDNDVTDLEEKLKEKSFSWRKAEENFAARKSFIQFSEYEIQNKFLSFVVRRKSWERWHMKLFHYRYMEQRRLHLSLPFGFRRIRKR